MEEKYAGELDSAQAQFDELRRQAEEMDSTKLQVARQSIHPKKEQTAAKYIQAALGKRFDPQIMSQIREDVAELLGETSESVSTQEKICQASERRINGTIQSK